MVGNLEWWNTEKETDTLNNDKELCPAFVENVAGRCEMCIVENGKDFENIL